MDLAKEWRRNSANSRSPYSVRFFSKPVGGCSCGTQRPLGENSSGRSRVNPPARARLYTGRSIEHLPGDLGNMKVIIRNGVPLLEGLRGRLERQALGGGIPGEN